MIDGTNGWFTKCLEHDSVQSHHNKKRNQEQTCEHKYLIATTRIFVRPLLKASGVIFAEALVFHYGKNGRRRNRAKYSAYQYKCPGSFWSQAERNWIVSGTETLNRHQDESKNGNGVHKSLFTARWQKQSISKYISNAKVEHINILLPQLSTKLCRPRQLTTPTSEFTTRIFKTPSSELTTRIF